MDITKNGIEINNKTNTYLLIDYLDGVIVDEMILNSYIRDLKIIQKTKTSLVIEVNSHQAKEIIESRYLTIFKQGIEGVFGVVLEPNIVLKGESSLYNSEQIENKNISKKFTFDKYVTSNFNEEVVNMAKRVVKNPGKFSPLYIASKSGLGKTHLLHAIGNEGYKNNYTSIYIEPNNFTKKVFDASKMGGDAINNLINSYIKYDLMLFDDIQNLGDRDVTLSVLFEIINRQIDRGKQIVIVSDRIAQELSGFESRFITRFVSGISSTINEPSKEDIEKILKFKLMEENMNPKDWEKSALSFIARNNTSSIRALEGAIKRILFYTENEKHTKYTYNVVSAIFKNLAVDPSELTPNRIIDVVSNYYKIHKKDLVGKSRKKEFVLPRHIAMYLIREITTTPLTEVGRYFGGRDHSTVINGVKQIDSSLKIDRALKMAVAAIEQKIKIIN